jgi:hypothetical protein
VQPDSGLVVVVVVVVVCVGSFADGEAVVVSASGFRSVGSCGGLL